MFAQKDFQDILPLRLPIQVKLSTTADFSVHFFCRIYPYSVGIRPFRKTQQTILSTLQSWIYLILWYGAFLVISPNKEVVRVIISYCYCYYILLV